MPHRSVAINNNNNNSSWNSSSFQIFFEDWLVRQEHYLDELLCAQTNVHEKSEDDLKDLIERVLFHYKQYYEVKSLVVQEDVYVVFSPIWFSSYERTFLWIAGFKPGLAIRLVGNSVDDLSEEQSERMDRLRLETRAEESELEEDMARVQESVAAPPFLELARRSARLIDGERNKMESAIEMLRSLMEVLVRRADFLRSKTTMKVLEILNPVQTVRFLVAAAQLQLRVRSWGLQRDTQRNP